MTAWRDGTPESVQADVDSMYSIALDFAESQLAEHGKIYPFGLKIARDSDKIALISAENWEVDAALHAIRDDLRAATSVSDVHVSALRTDAVSIHIEHVDGLALDTVVPYSRKRFGKKAELGQPLAQPGTRRILT